MRISLTDEILELEELRVRQKKALATWVAANQITQQDADRKEAVLSSAISRLKCLRVLTANAI